jgi:hypothetical protein
LHAAYFIVGKSDVQSSAPIATAGSLGLRAAFGLYCRYLGVSPRRAEFVVVEDQERTIG